MLDFIQKSHMIVLGLPPGATFYLTDFPQAPGYPDAVNVPLPDWLPQKLYIARVHLRRETISGGQISVLLDRGRAAYNSGAPPIHQHGPFVPIGGGAQDAYPQGGLYDWRKLEMVASIDANYQQQIERFWPPKFLDRAVDSLWIQNDGPLATLFMAQIDYLVPATEQPSVSGWPSPQLDPLRLQINADGVPDGSTNIVDTSPAPHVLTPSGGLHVSTAQAADGSGSLYFNGTDAVLTASAHGDWNLGSKDFTVDLWARPDDVSAGFRVLLCTGPSYTGLMIAQSGPSFLVYMSGAGTAWDTNGASLGVATAAAWSQLTVKRVGSSIQLLNNGALVTSLSATGSLAGSNGPLYIGNQGPSATLRYKGFLDSISLSRLA